MVEKVLQLRCGCNSYSWGKRGSKSMAARLAANTPGTDFKIDEDKDYAEMWMGTYPNLPSYVLETGENLQDVLNKHPDELIGTTVCNKFASTDLCFLPKLLSIAKALPLQLHPGKALAEELHRKNPSSFTDPNHKPEIAIALSHFEAFVGFKPKEDIDRLMQLGPLKRFLPLVHKPAFDDQTLKHVVKAILTAPEDAIAQVQEDLRREPWQAFGKDAYILDMIPRLQEQYSKTDPGTIVALITMNYITLKPFESIFIPADGIHAYLSGDIIECMARSNNVLNTGFCPAVDRDSVNLFMSSLTFTPHEAEEAMLKPHLFDRVWSIKNGEVPNRAKTLIYNPPMGEFDMLMTELGPGGKEKIEGLAGPSIMVATEGTGKMKAEGKEWELKEGYVSFVGQGVEVALEASEDRESTLRVFRAFVE